MFKRVDNMETAAHVQQFNIGKVIKKIEIVSVFSDVKLYLVNQDTAIRFDTNTDSYYLLPTDLLGFMNLENAGNINSSDLMRGWLGFSLFPDFFNSCDCDMIYNQKPFLTKTDSVLEPIPVHFPRTSATVKVR